MRTGWYRAVHVKTPSCRNWRALLTARRMVVNKRRDVESGVRALLREAGLTGCGKSPCEPHENATIGRKESS
jgi:transposase